MRWTIFFASFASRNINDSTQSLSAITPSASIAQLPTSPLRPTTSIRRNAFNKAVEPLSTKPCLYTACSTLPLSTNWTSMKPISFYKVTTNTWHARPRTVRGCSRRKAGSVKYARRCIVQNVWAWFTRVSASSQTRRRVCGNWGTKNVRLAGSGSKGIRVAL